ncbi:MAG: hypothetical protein ACXVHB_11430 [Solirubrobacteraceae bacterium]
MLWRPDEHEPLTDQEWDPGKASDAIAAIVADAEAAAEDGVWPTHALDEVPEEERFCSLYLGGAGMIWGLHRLGSDLDYGPRSRRPCTATGRPLRPRRPSILPVCWRARQASSWSRTS